MPWGHTIISSMTKSVCPLQILVEIICRAAFWSSPRTWTGYTVIDTGRGKWTAASDTVYNDVHHARWKNHWKLDRSHAGLFGRKRRKRKQPDDSDVFNLCCELYVSFLLNTPRGSGSERLEQNSQKNMRSKKRPSCTNTCSRCGRPLR